MKTYDIIVEQVSNAESLARAFTPQQWRAIIHYYRQNRGYAELTGRQLNGWLRDCGSGMIESETQVAIHLDLGIEKLQDMVDMSKSQVLQVGEKFIVT